MTSTFQILSGPIYFPTDGAAWETTTPQEAGWDPEALEAALSFAREKRSTGVLMLYRGRVLAEQYWPVEPREAQSDDQQAVLRAMLFKAMSVGKDAQGHPIEDVASVQKSLNATLACIARQKGLLQYDDPVADHLGAGWSNAPADDEAKITVRHLLTMSSGLDERLQFHVPAGEEWYYNTPAYQLVIRVVSAAAKMDHEILTREWLTGFLGMDDTRWLDRTYAPKIKEFPMLGLATSNRDLARFGLFILAGGRWGDRVIIQNPEHVLEMLRPSQKMNPSYGHLWWLNGQDKMLLAAPSNVAPTAGVAPPEQVDGPFLPMAPPDLVAALGALERKLYVVSSLGLVVTRLGDSTLGPDQPPDARSTFDRDLWTKIMAAAPKGGK